MKHSNFFTAITINEAYEAGFEEAKGNALFDSCFLDEPEKPVVPKYVADFISSEQCSCSTLSEAIDNMDDERQILNWFYINSETFAKAWIYGYKVEKEKLYRMKHNLTNEYLCFTTKRCFHSNEIKLFPPVQRTEKEWEELGYWNNNLYVPEEVEE